MQVGTFIIETLTFVHDLNVFVFIVIAKKPHNLHMTGLCANFLPPKLICRNTISTISCCLLRVFTSRTIKAQARI